MEIICYMIYVKCVTVMTINYYIITNYLSAYNSDGDIIRNFVLK